MAAANPSPRPESSTASSVRSGHNQNKLVSPDSNTKHVQASSDVQFKRNQNRLISPDSNTRHVQAQYKSSATTSLDFMARCYMIHHVDLELPD